MKAGIGRISRAHAAFVHDVVMAAVSFVGALALRLGDRVWVDFLDRYLLALVIFTTVCAGVFWFTGMYRGIWRYASMQDLLSIARAVTLALLIFLTITFLVTRLEELPRSFLIINWFLLIFLLGAPRMVYRVFKDRGFDHLLERRTRPQVPVLLVGAGDDAETFIRESKRDRQGAYDVVGALDDKGGRIGRRIHDVPVFGRVSDLPDVVARLRKRGQAPQRLIVTRPLERGDMEQLLDAADANGMTLARLPRWSDFKTATAEHHVPEGKLDVRPVAIEDLLRRPQVSLDRHAMARMIDGRRVLVTGSGGSIGSELVRQVARFTPEQLILLDHSEFLLYRIDREVAEQAPHLARRAVLCDVRDRRSLETVFAEERPELVLHAAALKHVPLCEANPTAAVLTNVVGARNVAEASQKAGARTVVQVSTDKVVNPTNVMGATKRLAESYCQALDLAARGEGEASGATRFVTVRFGNVLGSTGSVVPLFEEQLKRGDPLTVTHPEMRRYFMTVREAVQLVLQAAALGAAEEVGKIYVLDMGEPVRIVDLARQIIRLAGLRPGKDVTIRFTGMRPGEKLREELFHPDEGVSRTAHPSLRLAAARTFDLELLRRSVEALGEHAAAGRRQETLIALRRLVPEFQPREATERDEAIQT